MYPQKRDVTNVIHSTQPSFAVGALSIFSLNPTAQHMKAAQCLLRYISKTHHYGLHFRPFVITTQPTATLFRNADWAGDRESQKSTSAYMSTISSGQPLSPQTAITCSSKQQATVALSSMEAEYMSVMQACKGAIWVQQFIREIRHASLEKELGPPIMIFTDTQGCMALAMNPEFHNRTKYIDIQQHFIREKVDNGDVHLKYLPTGDMVADLLIKALPYEKVERFRKEIGIHEI